MIAAFIVPQLPSLIVQQDVMMGPVAEPAIRIIIKILVPVFFYLK